MIKTTGTADGYITPIEAKKKGLIKTARDSWLSGQSESVRKNWFISTSKYFANINKKNMSEDLSAKAKNLRIANVNKWIAANISSDIEAVLAKIKKSCLGAL